MAKPSNELKICGLCRRQVPRTTRHHLVPRCRSRKRKRRGQVDRIDAATMIVKGEERPSEHTTVDLCVPCHAQVHALLTEKELESDYFTVERMLSHPEIGVFVAWVRKQPTDRRIAVRSSGRLKR